jgi:hypothetical protein
MKAKGLRGQGNGLSQKLALRKGLAAERKPSISSAISGYKTVSKNFSVTL